MNMAADRIKYHEPNGNSPGGNSNGPGGNSPNSSGVKPDGKSPAEITRDICRHNGFLILEAGAGTGKTFNLTERVIHQLVDRKVPLERMLALTFTDFAAAEMRSRIYAAINRNIGVSDHLLKTRRLFSRNYISTFHSFCNRILQYFPDELTEISVADSPECFGKPDEQRYVDGAFELLSDYDEVLWMMEWRKRFYQKYKDHDGLQRQLSLISVSDFEKFMKELSGVDEQALCDMSVITPAMYLGRLSELAKRWRQECDRLQSELIETLRAHPEWFKSPDKIPGTINKLKAARIKDGLSKKLFDKEEADKATLGELDRQALEVFGRMDALEMVDAYLAGSETERELAEYPLQEEFNANHEAYWNMRDLAELALRWNTLMRYQRFDAGYFNYDDMIWLTHRLFTEHPAVTARMRSRFDQILVDEFQDTDRRQWEIISRLAFGNGEPGVSSPDKEMLIVGDVKQAIYGFRGGDVAMMRRVKERLAGQSRIPDSLPLKIQALPYSFRSNRAVITFANRLFRNVFGPESAAASYEAYHQPLKRPSAELSRNAEAGGEVRVLAADCKELGKGLDAKKGRGEPAPVEAEVLTDHHAHLEARRIARFLRDIFDGRQVGYAAIQQKMTQGEKAVGVLYKRRKHMYALEEALREADLPFTVAKGTRYYMRREVRDAWLLLSFLLDAYDDVSLVGLLRSPMISFSDSGLLGVRVVMDNPDHGYPNFWSAVSDHKAWESRLSDTDRRALKSGVPLLKKLREMVPNRRVSELVEQAFFTDGPYIGAHPDDSQVRENLVKLLDVIRNLESTGRGTLFEISEFLSNRIQEEAGDSEAEQPDPAPIQLMTIHGSKGLQFPMVVIPDMHAGDHDGGVQLFVADDDPDSVVWPGIVYKPGDRERGRQSNTGNNNGSDKDADGSFLYQIIKSEKNKRQRAETKRLFYVAVTRAETHLLMSVTNPKSNRSKGTFAELLMPWIDEQGEWGQVYDEQAGGDALGQARSGEMTDDMMRDGVVPDQEENRFRVNNLTVDELEDLAVRPLADSSEPNEQAEPAEPTGTAPSEPDYLIPDRSAKHFMEAEAMVSAEILSASGRSTEKARIEEEMEEKLREPDEQDHVSAQVSSGHPAGQPQDLQDLQLPQWKDISPADAGTLIHRTLETGPDPEAASQEELERFWMRELIRMNCADHGAVAGANSLELRRHCRNALKWIKKHFGEEAQKRFEIAFEISVTQDLARTDLTRAELARTKTVPEKRVTIRGSIDMIVRGSDGRHHIVDFKTGPVGESGLIDHARTHGYVQQIQTYLMAWQTVMSEASSVGAGGIDKRMDNRMDMNPERVWLVYTSPVEALAISLQDTIDS